MVIVLLTAAISVAIADEMIVKSEPIRPQSRASLFNGRDFSGWTKVISKEEGACPDTTWSVRNGLICCTGQPYGYLMTQQSYADYKLNLEYRWSARSEEQNSGVFVHKSGGDTFFLPKAIEIQLKDGHAGDFVLLSKATLNGEVNDKHKLLKRTGEPSEKPFGEWNRVTIEVSDGTVISYINGTLQNVGRDAYTDAGNICLQSEGGPIEFRNLTIEPLH